MRRAAAAVGAAIATLIAACASSTGEPAPVGETPRALVLGEIALAEARAPLGTTYLRSVHGLGSAVRLVQDGGPAVQVDVQRGLVDALTREFGSQGVRAVTLHGAPTESLDPADVLVSSGVSAYRDEDGAVDAFAVISDHLGTRYRATATSSLGDAGLVFRGRFLRAMPLTGHVWRNGAFVLSVLAIGAFDRMEVRQIVRGMDGRARSAQG
jgi:hypothetical protein